MVDGWIITENFHRMRFCPLYGKEKYAMMQIIK